MFYLSRETQVDILIEYKIPCTDIMYVAPHITMKSISKESSIPYQLSKMPMLP